MNTECLEILKTIVPTLGTIIVSIISSICVIKSTRKTIENEKKHEYAKRLEEFYYPILLLLKKSTQLHQVLMKLKKIDEKGCLIHLLQGKTLEGNSLYIFNEILVLDKQINDLILKYSKYISNKDLQMDLTNLSTHYSILFLANEGKLVEDVDILSEFVYPKDIVESIEKEIKIVEQKAKD